MNNIWFSSDHHFSHRKIILLNKRPFSSIEEHDEELIKRWNERVKPHDNIYNLGDFAFLGKTKGLELVNRLNGNKFMIRGSHDSLLQQLRSKFMWVKDVYLLKIEHYIIFLSHHAHRVWPQSHYNTYHLFGHSHGRLEPWGKSFDVGVDAWNYYPVSLDQVIEKMNTLPDNFNLVRAVKDVE